MRSVDSNSLLAACSHLNRSEQDDVQKAFDFAVRKHDGQERADGTPYVTHVIEVATILAEWEADRDTVVAALLHDVLEDTDTSKEEITLEFGKQVGVLVEGITKFTQADLDPLLELERKTETLRKLFDVMRQDIRSIIIKLADRLHNIQTMDALPPERQRRFAVETMDVYYKIAFHLGMRQLRREFAERCMPLLLSDQAVVRDRDRWCQRFRSLPYTIERYIKAQENGPHIENIFLQQRNLQIFDEKRGMRDGVALPQDAFSIVVVVPDEESCYHFLKAIHNLYRPIVGQFRDFIAAPSDAGYKSIHTHVALPEGDTVEIRIYTPEMYTNAMLGITYALFQKGSVESSFSWLHRSEELDIKTRESSSAFWEAVESDILRETISVTVDRKRVALPSGATVLDAAFAAHDQVANRTVRITVNGVESQLSKVAQEDDDIHVTLHELPQVTIDWLGYVSTRHARFLISEEMKHHTRAEKISLGSKLLQREFDHYGKGLLQHLSKSQHQSVAEHYRRISFEQVLAMIGEGVLRPRDVVFYLFPEEKKQPIFWRKTSDFYRFRVAVTFAHPKQDPLSILTTTARENHVIIDTVSQDVHSDSINFQIVGHTDSRIQFADFVESLERYESCAMVETLIPAYKKTILVASFLLAFLVLIADIIFLPWYHQISVAVHPLPRLLLQALPVLPILIANFYLLRLLRHYFVRMRSDRWYLGIGFFLNFVGLLLLTLQMILTGFVQTLLPLIAIFVASLLVVGYRFFRVESVFAPLDEQQLTAPSKQELQKRNKQKMIGYAIRFGAVVIWGLEPIMIRYSSVNQMEPFLRAFLFSIGLLIPTTFLYIVQSLWTKKKFPSFAIPYVATFYMIALGRVGFLYFYNASLVYTTGTNLILFNNFAPLLALIIAAFFWRKSIPYLRQPKVMLMVFLLAIIAGTGSSLLVMNSVATQSTSAVVGDILAVMAMLFDVILVTGQIEYIKQFRKTNALLLSIHVFSFVLLCIAPIIIVSTLINPDFLIGLTNRSMMVALGIGSVLALGQFLNYEAFKRIDGYLAFMMFNISVLIAFMTEAFYLKTVEPTYLLIISGIMIIGASVFAEYVNSRCEKKGL